MLDGQREKACAHDENMVLCTEGSSERKKLDSCHWPIWIVRFVIFVFVTVILLAATHLMDACDCELRGKESYFLSLSCSHTPFPLGMCLLCCDLFY